MTTYTEEQAQELVTAAVAAAIAPLQSELAGLRDAATAGQLDARITEAVAAAVAPLEEQLTEARTARDKADADLNAVTAQRDELVAAAEAAEAAADEAAAYDERLATRVTAVREVASFTDEQVATRGPEWAAMEEPAFAVLIETLRSSGIAPRTPAVRPSALTAAEGSPSGSVMGQALAAMRGRTAPRTV